MPTTSARVVFFTSFSPKKILPAQNMVDRGWVSNLDALVSESLQRYLESHQEAMTEQFIREDVEWGLRGHD